KILRTIGQPELRFNQDPVRMIRLIKFCARFNFEIDPTTFEALLSCRKAIIKSSSARVLEELLRMLESGASKPFFHLLQEYGLLSALMPELSYFLQNKESAPLILQLLEEVDSEIKKGEQSIFDRSLLIAILIFPLFDQFLKERTLSETRPPHLGQIGSDALYVIDCVFSPFFTIPRRIRSIAAFIMASQYRFCPLDGREVRHPRLPNDPSTPLALELFKIRSSIQPELLPQYTKWTEVAFREQGEEGDAPKERRRPRRRRRR
ncbi:MAG: polynucleotide adenylyltransferase PcnB, partial [Chlamydiae bacterium]|nr:polynucleotide adenylyltransferase PcnB [Chlamydiota bacterium]